MVLPHSNIKVTDRHTGSIRRDQPLLNDAELFYPIVRVLSPCWLWTWRNNVNNNKRKKSVHEVAVTLPKLSKRRTTPPRGIQVRIEYSVQGVL